MSKRNKSLIIKNHRSSFITLIRIFVGKFILKFKLGKVLPKYLTEFYITKSRKYEFQSARRNTSEIEKITPIRENIIGYIEEQKKEEIKNLSQYYPYEKVSKIINVDKKFTICTVGIFYAKAEFTFLQNHKSYKNLKLYGLDFGDIKSFNEDFITEDRLELINGYSLESLEELYKKGINLDLAIFVRTCSLMNPNEFKEYIKTLGKFCNSIMFLEIAKLTFNPISKVDLSEISTDKSLKLFSGLYLHNYIKVPEKYGFKKVIEAKVVPAKTFPQQSLTKDHDFVFVHVSK